MKASKNFILKYILIAVTIAVALYFVLLSTERKGLVDMCIEAVLFFCGSMIAFRGFLKDKSNSNFSKFKFFYGLTYLLIVISFCVGIYYFIKNPAVVEIKAEDVSDSSVLIIHSLIKSLSIICLIFTWSYFYKYLNIDITFKKKVSLYLFGASLYMGASIVIWRLVNDASVLSLGFIVGIVVGIFACIARDYRARYLTIIFSVYSIIHLVEFYMMGKGMHLVTGINNPIYWGTTVLYILEVRRWISMEEKKSILNERKA
ncbi:hypothetical protein PV797_01405 [Clostridiaceae bacterium M8S5]|nr:hypothetical protein PV797_01405 [Clostridiaceae bacterium M8S5]